MDTSVETTIPVSYQGEREQVYKHGISRLLSKQYIEYQCMNAAPSEMEVNFAFHSPHVRLGFPSKQYVNCMIQWKV